MVKEWKGGRSWDVTEKKAGDGVFVVCKSMKDPLEGIQASFHMSTVGHTRRKKTLRQNAAGSGCENQRDKTLAHVTN